MTPPRGGESAHIRPLTLWAALGAYALLLLSLMSRHEMWRDEVRALTVATKTASVGAMLTELRHEGHPALWYLLLRGAYAVTQSNLVLPACALLVAFATAWLILKRAPFPVWLRLLAVFSAALGYEISVVSRNYGLGVLFLVLACIAYESRRNRPLLLGLALAALANTSIHAAAAALIIGLFWLSGLLDEDERTTLVSVEGIAAIAIAISGVGVAALTARPTPDMAWSASLDSVSVGEALRNIFADPGFSLRGYAGANIAATQEFPWRFTGIEPFMVGRIIVDVLFVWLLWHLRKSWRVLASVALAILGFAFLFRNAYTASQRHEDVLLFLIFAICWMEIVRRGRAPETIRGVSLGLLPLFAFQTAALPIVAHRYFVHPESASKAYSSLIRETPRYRDAILMSEPDYLMESLPYYVGNRVYMPRQGEYSDRVYFDRGTRRRALLSLGELIQIADSVGCQAGKPVLLAVGYGAFVTDSAGTGRLNYKGTRFTWSVPDWRALRDRQPERRPVAWFPNTTSDEFYTVYELDPSRGGCF